MTINSIKTLFIAAAVIFTVTQGFISCSKDKSGDIAAFRNIKPADTRTGLGTDIEFIFPDGTSSYLSQKILMDLPPASFTYYDPWDKCDYSCIGINLGLLLEASGITENQEYVTLSAANNYSIPVRTDDLRKIPYYLVYSLNGTKLPDPDYENKGNYIVAIDFSSGQDISLEIYKHQLVWQFVKAEAGINEK